MHSSGRHPSIPEAGPRASLLSGGRTCRFDLETSTASWLCNVQSQAWPAALGCPSAVMGPAYVFRQPERENSGRRGDQEEQQQPRNPLRSSRQVRQGGGLGSTPPAHPPGRRPAHGDYVPGEGGRPWLLGLPVSPPSFRARTHGQRPFLWADVLFLLWGVRPATGGEVFGGQITFACPSASEPPAPLPGRWSSVAPNQVLGIRAARGSFPSEGPEGK